MIAVTLLLNKNSQDHPRRKYQITCYVGVPFGSNNLVTRGNTGGPHKSQNIDDPEKRGRTVDIMHTYLKK